MCNSVENFEKECCIYLQKKYICTIIFNELRKLIFKTIPFAYENIQTF